MGGVTVPIHHLQRLCGQGEAGVGAQPGGVSVAGRETQGRLGMRGESQPTGKILLVSTRNVCFRLGFVINMMCVRCVRCQARVGSQPVSQPASQPDRQIDNLDQDPGAHSREHRGSQLSRQRYIRAVREGVRVLFVLRVAGERQRPRQHLVRQDVEWRLLVKDAKDILVKS
ncbi:hypothetical protein E2C01_078019 [Portunus trituberculatus]|uniref:Uncharacterized protein n=1 Tax=Portunus trituberculatus TaxID=210409 RepID=A0A5B7IHM9_PORTR|nr:hypothetical protein [Portunus trituberculatus]